MAFRSARAAAGDAGRRLSHPSDSVKELKAFQRGLAETGYVDGKNIAIEFRLGRGTL
jgi:hypothetical protein